MAYRGHQQNVECLYVIKIEGIINVLARLAHQTCLREDVQNPSMRQENSSIKTKIPPTFLWTDLKKKDEVLELQNFVNGETFCCSMQY
uniref:Uncharacterized protein LOC111117705 isoform X2 n=1 Tax=Crassostrea virginica TaxID=6565 RepID=A0A8B8CAB3_CRAVI|nr:uncharacterized protein LOC111117705 isoform X2 [Crassostrea virginica]